MDASTKEEISVNARTTRSRLSHENFHLSLFPFPFSLLPASYLPTYVSLCPLCLPPKSQVKTQVKTQVTTAAKVYCYLQLSSYAYH